MLGKLVKTALDETRMLVLAAGILLGFQLRGVFEQGFAHLPVHARYLDGAALLLMVVTVGLLISPEGYHQMVEGGNDSGRFHQWVSRMAGYALLPFALSLGASLCVAGERILGIAGGIALGGFFMLFALACWYGLEYLRRSRAGYRERAATAREHDMTEQTSLAERITELLTEARVVLPGVQALLGFQLATAITQPFAELPASSKLMHAASLFCVTVSVVFLVTPAAYHRIVFAGQEAEEVHRVGSWFVTWATAPLALGLAGDVYVVLATIASSTAIGAVAGVATLLLLLGLWYALPGYIRYYRHAGEASTARR
jgi:hypothetical protein